MATRWASFGRLQLNRLKPRMNGIETPYQCGPVTDGGNGSLLKPAGASISNPMPVARDVQGAGSHSATTYPAASQTKGDPQNPTPFKACVDRDLLAKLTSPGGEDDRVQIRIWGSTLRTRWVGPRQGAPGDWTYLFLEIE
jgi:hypothetical protein